MTNRLQTVSYLYLLRIRGSTCKGTWTPTENLGFNCLHTVGTIIANYRKAHPDAIHVEVNIAAPAPSIVN
jgi:hypothetical protein